VKAAATTLGDYITEEEPIAALWQKMVDIVYRDSPNGELGRLSPAARTLFDCGRFSGEITNGGFGQFFDNSTGDTAHEILDSLRRIGASLSVGLLEKAMSLFPGGRVPTDCVERAKVTNGFGERETKLLDELDQTFYTRVDPVVADSLDENLAALELAYMRVHSAEPVEA